MERREFEFTLVLSGVNELSDDVLNALFEGGCDDATFALRFGRIFGTFIRESTSMKDAVLSAIANVRCAGIGADVLRVDYCDLLTQAEIARKLNCSRQQIHLYVTGASGPKGFPPPACDLTDGSPMWHWCDVANWLFENGRLEASAVTEAQEVRAINDFLEWDQLRDRDPRLAEEIARAVNSDCCG